MRSSVWRVWISLWRGWEYKTQNKSASVTRHQGGKQVRFVLFGIRHFLRVLSLQDLALQFVGDPDIH